MGDSTIRALLQKAYYEPMKRLGLGAYGEVWLADDKTGKPVAVKVLKVGGGQNEDSAGISDLLRELYVMGTLARSSQNLAPLTRVEFIPDYLEDSVLVEMPVADGDLNQWLDKNAASMTLEQVTAIIQDLLCGLSELHQIGWGHFDLKPANILVYNNRFKLADFGLAFDFSACYSRGPSEVITWNYRPSDFYRAKDFGSPHCNNGHLTQAADVWSMGLVILEVLVSYILRKRTSLWSIMTRNGWNTEETWFPQVVDKLGSQKVKQLAPAVDQKQANKFQAPDIQWIVELIDKMLDDSPAHRISAEDALKFVAKHNPDSKFQCGSKRCVQKRPGRPSDKKLPPDLSRSRDDAEGDLLQQWNEISWLAEDLEKKFTDAKVDLTDEEKANIPYLTTLLKWRYNDIPWSLAVEGIDLLAKLLAASQDEFLFSEKCGESKASGSIPIAIPPIQSSKPPPGSPLAVSKKRKPEEQLPKPLKRNATWR
jgi:serine/threonine protein kinase